ESMRQTYQVGKVDDTGWWSAPGYQTLNESLPADLLDDFKKIAVAPEDAA
ncbi:hypothetical protein ALO78_04831, partial [Pseudomonas amygdali pv. ciccaronei]